MYVVGHRGARGVARENTLAAVRQAMGCGVTAVELDIQVALDDTLVLHHDPCVPTQDQRCLWIPNHRWPELIESPLNVPLERLDELLPACPGLTEVQLEIKTGRLVRPLPAVVNAIEACVGRCGMTEAIIFTSDNTALLRTFQRLASPLARGYVANTLQPDPVATARRLGCQWLVLNHRYCHPTLVTRAHQRGLKVSVWTVNRVERLQALAQWGVDSVITDYPCKFNRPWFRG